MTSLHEIWHFVRCGMFLDARWTTTPWLPVGMADWVRIVTCSRCKDKWEQYR